MPDRIEEIRARLDALDADGPCGQYPRTIVLSFEMRDLFAADIAWLLAEVERLRAHRPVRFPYGKPDTGAF